MAIILKKRRNPILLHNGVLTKTMVDIIIPTYENYQILLGCLQSFLENTHPGYIYRIMVANNGIPKSLNSLNRSDGKIKVYDMGENLGWEGAINKLLPMTTADIVCFMNDDIHILANDPYWIMKCLAPFQDPKVGAVGPSSNYVMQRQNIFMQGLPQRMDVPVLIGFCLFVRGELIKRLDGLGKDLPGGDDLDLSMRIEEAGYKLRCLRTVFVYHHGAQTGRRVFGKYWDSEEHQDKTNIELIKRNGFKKFMRCRYGPYKDVSDERFEGMIRDAEGDRVREYIKGTVVIDIGCGPHKTIEESIGVDMINPGETVKSLDGAISKADVQGNAYQLPFENESVDCIIARHLLEHLIDPIKALKEWNRILKNGGRLILALPDENIGSTIPLNPEHVHAYTPETLNNLVTTIFPSYKNIFLESIKNGISFVAIYDKA